MAAFKDSVIREDVAALSRISGVGKKTAERIVLELKDKVGVVGAWQEARATATNDPSKTAQNDAVLALIALGFKQGEAQKAVQAQLKQPGLEGTPSVDKLVREALRALN